MLRNILILTVSVLSLQSISYAADSDKLTSDAISAITQQSVVINEIEDIVKNTATAQVVGDVVESITNSPEATKVKKTIGQKIKSFFANLFICLKATNEVVKDVVDNKNAITNEIQGIRDVIGSIKNDVNNIKNG